MKKNYKYIRFALILSALCLLSYNVFVLKVNFFYLLYLYWFDECFRTLGAWTRVRSTSHIANSEKEGQIVVNGESKTLSPQSAINVRIFFLCLYFVFIVFGFGFMFPLFSDSSDDLLKNIQIVTFAHLGFNLNLGIFLLREIVSYWHEFVLTKKYNATNLMPFPDTIDKQTLVLHLSIILGGGVWVLSKNKLLFGLDLSAGEYGYLLIIPFVVIRLVVEIILFVKKEET